MKVPVRHILIPRTKKLADLTADDVPPGMDPEDVAVDFRPQSRGEDGRAMTGAKTDAEIKKALLKYFENEENIRLWLNFPHPDLGGKTPQQVIDAGKGQAVLNMLEKLDWETGGR